ncbi:DUF6273 domain-containing protein [Caproicibacterium amylolyticum]|uniref:DUF6273 domain-containing protein n=1 Tax=Caproicibacterium amylolyticum TaxID=2766537 RepID=A0A7G9WJE4_9FIRM|nr:DUF6273 domain-containing protein [Caproicibacterium amylolyticum]QNO18806.1 hypothetical protein H6X83_04000 [Caproicibacterium amylolyticum]
MSRYAKQSGALHEVTERYAKVNGVWQQVTARYVKQNGAWNQVYSSGKKLSDLPVGSLLKINESGVPQQYIIVHQGNPDTSIYDISCNGTWVMRSNLFVGIKYSNIYDVTSFLLSNANSWLNNTFVQTLSIQNQLINATIPCIFNSVQCKAFLLSVSECGDMTRTESASEGKPLTFFQSDAAEQRKSYANYSILRTPFRQITTSGNQYVVQENSWGYMQGNTTNDAIGFRPAMILNSDALVSSSVDSDNCYTLQ